MNIPDKHILNRVSDLFIESGLKPVEIAKRVNITDSYVRHIINKTYNGNMSGRVIQSIAVAFNVNENWLRTGLGDFHQAAKISEETNLYNSALDYKVEQLCDRLRSYIARHPKERDRLVAVVETLTAEPTVAGRQGKKEQTA